MKTHITVQSMNVPKPEREEPVSAVFSMQKSARTIGKWNFFTHNHRVCNEGFSFYVIELKTWRHTIHSIGKAVRQMQQENENN